MPDHQPAIVVKDLDMGYGDFVLMRDLNFTVNRGDVFIIMGGSGCGKSTLLKILVGLKTPTRGQVFYGDTDFWGSEPETREKLQRRFGILYQSGALWSSMTLAENIALPLEQYTDLSPSRTREVVSLKLALVGLAGFEDFYPSEISGGMKKRAGLLNSNIDVGIKVPQQLMASVFHQVNPRWAVLGSVGWQQWSKFGQVQLGIDNAGNPTGVTKDLNFKDTWHFAAGAQYRLSDPWLLNFGAAYDSKFQSGSTVSPMLPVNDAWRFGAGVQNQVSKRFSWGFAAEYAYGGALDLNQQSELPVELGGRGDLSGSFRNAGIFFFGVNFMWTF